MRKARRKISNVGLHGRVPEALGLKGAHFAKSLLGCPPIKSNPVGCEEHSGPIATQPAVDEYPPSRPVPNKGEKLSNLFILRRRPTVDRYVDETHAQGFGELVFFLHCVMSFTSEIDDGVDAEFLKLLNSFLLRLRAAVEKFVHLAGIRNAWNLDFLCESELFGRPRRVVMGGAASSRGRQKQQQEKRKEFAVDIISLDTEDILREKAQGT
jgi:hypothetical protein